MWRDGRRIGAGGLERLSPQDVSNLRVEARGLPMHVAALAILDGRRCGAPRVCCGWMAYGPGSKDACIWCLACARCSTSRLSAWGHQCGWTMPASTSATTSGLAPSPRPATALFGSMFDLTPDAPARSRRPGSQLPCHPHGLCSPTTSGATEPRWPRSARGWLARSPPFAACGPTPPSWEGSSVRGTRLAPR